MICRRVIYCPMALELAVANFHSVLPFHYELILKKTFNILASRVALGFAAVATPHSLPLPSLPPLRHSPCALLRGLRMCGGVGSSGVHLPPA